MEAKQEASKKTESKEGMHRVDTNYHSPYAIIRGVGLPISLKASVEICNLLRHKETKKAKSIMERVIKKQQPVPFKIYRGETPHRAGKIAEGRYPIKASKEFLQLIKSVEGNAHNIGLAGNLVITEIRAGKGPQQFHYGRQRRIRHKRTHVTIKVSEQAGSKKSQEKQK